MRHWMLLAVPFCSFVLLCPREVLAQAPPALPATLHAEVGLFGPAASRRYATVDLQMGTGDWALEGCTGTVSGSCRATRRVVLTTAQRQELVRLWVEVASMPRCEPVAFVAGDAEYRIDTPGVSYRGHLPAAESDVPARTAGVCLADARLAVWLARTFGP